jgi:hypothetical protein
MKGKKKNEESKTATVIDLDTEEGALNGHSDDKPSVVEDSEVNTGAATVSSTTNTVNHAADDSNT